MANELTVTATIKAVLDGITHSEDSGTLQFDVAGKNVLRHVQNIGTSEEAIVLGDITVGGYMFAKNLDATNYVEIRQGTGAGDFCRLKAGQIALIPTSPDMTAPYAIADTASCAVLFIFVDL